MDQLGSVPPLSISALSIHNTTTTENAVTGWNTPNYTTTTIFHLDSDLDQAVIHTQHPTTFVKQRKLKRRKKKKRRKGKTMNDLSNPIDRGPNTFGVGDRNIYPLNPYRNVDVNIDLSMDRSIQPETTASGNFVSTSPRFVVRTSISESESGNAKRNRLVQENMEKIKKRIDGPKPLRSTAAQDALLDGVAMLQASLQALAKIDQDCLQLEEEKYLERHQQSTTPTPMTSQETNKTNAEQKRYHTTFGVGIQRNDKLYRTVIPTSWTNPDPACTPPMTISSFQIKQPTRPSSAYSFTTSRSPRPCNIIKNATNASSPRLDSKRTQKTQTPTVIRLQRRKQERPSSAYPALHSQANKWKQKQLDEELIMKSAVPTSKSLAATSTTTRMKMHRYTLHRPNSATPSRRKIQNIETDSESAEPRKKTKVKDRYRKVKRVKRRPMSAVARNRKLQQSKRKFNQKNNPVYKFDDWMQTYVIPRA